MWSCRTPRPRKSEELVAVNVEAQPVYGATSPKRRGHIFEAHQRLGGRIRPGRKSRVLIPIPFERFHSP